eukprot:gene22492-30753_t
MDINGLSIEYGSMADMAGNYLSGISARSARMVIPYVNGLALACKTYIVDSDPPVIMVADLDWNSGELKLILSEPVNLTYVGVSKAGAYPLDDQVIVILGPTDLIFLQDFVGNFVVPVSSTTPRKVVIQNDTVRRFGVSVALNGSTFTVGEGEDSIYLSITLSPDIFFFLKYYAIAHSARPPDGLSLDNTPPFLLRWFKFTSENAQDIYVKLIFDDSGVQFLLSQSQSQSFFTVPLSSDNGAALYTTYTNYNTVITIRIEAECGLYSDQTCAICSSCKFGKYIASSCSTSTIGGDTVCSQCDECQALQYPVRDCGLGLNRLCASCQSCNLPSPTAKKVCMANGKYQS